MRTARLKGNGLCYYHVVSRVIERRFALDNGEKERFRGLMRKVEAFTGVKVVTYAALTNHVHLLLQVDTVAKVDESEVLRRMQEYYEGQDWVGGYAQRVRTAREAGNTAEAERLLEAYRIFVFDQGLTHQKAGTDSDAFRVRAEKAVAQGGRLGRADLLRCRVRYFCDGAVLGSRAFVQDVFLAHRSRFGVRRRNGPRPMRGTDLDGLFTMRDLKRSPIVIPPPRSV